MRISDWSSDVCSSDLKSFGCVGVLGADGRLLGIITDGDLRRHMANDLLDRTAAEVMTREPRTIRANALAAEALAEMNLSRRPFTSMFVTDEDARPIGIDRKSTRLNSSH